MRRRFMLICTCMCSLMISTMTTRSASADEASAPTPVLDEASSPIPAARGLALGAFFGNVSGNFAVGAQLTSPWFLETLRVNVGAGAAFYPGTTGTRETGTWEPFGLGQARIEVGPNFFRGAPLRPYSFGGVLLALLPDVLSDTRVAVGGLGGIGLEVGHWHPDERSSSITYGFELAGVGSGATVRTADGNENLLSGLMINGSIRGYLW